MNLKIAKIFNGETGTAIVGKYISIQVYKGTQPTATAFAAGYSTLYNPTTGSEILCFYGSTSTNFYNTWSVSRNATSLFSDVTNSSYTTYYRDGTATWAAIFFDTGININTGTPNSGRSQYMIVPVTDPSGTGIVRLNSVTVSGSTPAFSDLNLSFIGS